MSNCDSDLINCNCVVGDGGSESGFEMKRECGEKCSCGLDCANRITQRGVSVKLKIVRVVNKGWGLFAAEFVRKGGFICEYAGEYLTTEESRKRQKVYDELASKKLLSPALIVIREHLPSGKSCLRANIDATKIGNVGRFINHSCDGGNLSAVLVRNTGSLLPRLCFFAALDINDGSELTFSYGEGNVRSNGLPCFCGSGDCRGVLPSEDT